jgi:hypothetical protein
MMQHINYQYKKLITFVSQQVLYKKQIRTGKKHATMYYHDKLIKCDCDTWRNSTAQMLWSQWESTASKELDQLFGKQKVEFQAEPNLKVNIRVVKK